MALVDYLQQHVLRPEVLEQVFQEIRAEVEQRLSGRARTNTDALESEISRLRAEQRRYAKAVADAGDIAELVSEMKRRERQIETRERALTAARCGPDLARAGVQQLERAARKKLMELRQALASDRDGLRQVFEAMFPDGLVFHPAENVNRRVWAISGVAHLGGSRLVSDPTGT